MKWLITLLLAIALPGCADEAATYTDRAQELAVEQTDSHGLEQVADRQTDQGRDQDEGHNPDPATTEEPINAELSGDAATLTEREDSHVANGPPLIVPTPDTWPLFRGDSLSTGVSPATLPARPQVVWKKPFENGAFEASAIIVDGTIYVGGLDAHFYALDLATGAEKWNFETELGFSGPAAFRDGAIFVGDEDGRVFCLDAATGKPRWGFETKAEVNASPNFYADNVLIGSQDATLYCLRCSDGNVVWEHQIEDMIQCSPTVVENRCFLAGCDGKLHVVNLDNGEGVAQVELDAQTGCTPAVLGEMVFFGTEGATFFGINWREAEIKWTFHDPRRAYPIRSSAALAPGVIIFGARDKMVHGLDVESGREVWSYNAGSRVDSSPVLVENRAFVGTSRGRLIALDAKSGELVWEYDAGGGFTASPAVAAGRLVIGNEDGTMYCFGGE